MIEQTDIIRTKMVVEGAPQYAADVKQGASALDNFAGSEDRAAQGASSLQTGLQALAALGIATIFEKATRAMVAAASEMETYERQFTRLTGSAQLAGEKIEWLHKMAREPFMLDFEQVAEAAKTMDVFGLAVGNGEEQLRLFADAARTRRMDIEQVMMVMARMKEGMYMARTAMPLGITPSGLKERGVEFEGRTPLQTPENLAKLFPAAMDILTQQYGGMTKEMADTTETATHRMAMAFDEVKDELGEGLLPIVKVGADVVTAFTDVIKELDPALLRSAALFMGVTGAASMYLAAQQGILAVKRLGIVAENTSLAVRQKEVMVTGELAAAKVKEVATSTAIIAATEKQSISRVQDVAAIEKQALALWEKDKAELVEQGVGTKIIAQLEAETMARHRAALATAEQTAALEAQSVAAAQAAAAALAALAALAAGQRQLPLYFPNMQGARGAGGQLPLPIMIDTGARTTAQAAEAEMMAGNFSRQGRIASATLNAETVSTKAWLTGMGAGGAAAGGALERIPFGGGATGIGKFAKGIAPVAASLGKMVLWIGAITEGINAISALSEKVPEAQFGNLPGKYNRWEQLGSYVTSPISTIIRDKKAKKSREQELAYWAAQGGEVARQSEGDYYVPEGAQTRLGNREKLAGKTSEELQHAELMNESEAKRAQLIEKQLRLEGLKLKGYDDQVKLAQEQGKLEEAGYDEIKKRRESTEESIKGLQDKQAEIAEAQNARRIVGLEAGIEKQKESLGLLDHQAKLAALVNQHESDNIPVIEAQVAGYKELVAQIEKIIPQLGQSKQDQEERIKLTKQQQDAELAAAEGAKSARDIRKKSDEEHLAAIKEAAEAEAQAGFTQWENAKRLREAEHAGKLSMWAAVEQNPYATPAAKAIARQAQIDESYNAPGFITGTPSEQKAKWQGAENQRTGIELRGKGAQEASQSAWLDYLKNERDMAKLAGQDLRMFDDTIKAATEGLIDFDLEMAKRFSVGSPEWAEWTGKAQGLQKSMMQEAAKPVPDRFSEKLGGAASYPAKLMSELHQQAINAPAGLTELLPSQAILNRMKGNRLARSMKPDNSVTVIQLNLAGMSRQEIHEKIDQALNQRDDNSNYEAGNYTMGGGY